MFDQVHALISRFVSFSDREKEILENAFTFREVPAGFSLLKEGQIARELYFVNQGLLRLYYHNDGEPITAYIFRENLFASSYDSFLQAAPSIQCLEALEDSSLLVLSREGLDEVYRKVPAMHILTRNIAEQRFINAQRILASFLMDSPEERYRKFAAEHGDLFLRVPHHMIASYLGITPVSLSRIRKRIRDKA